MLMFVSLTATLIAANEQEEKGDVTSLEFVNGNCIYSGTVLGDGESSPQADPCEEWTCNVTGQSLQVKGCSLSDSYGSCIPYSSGRIQWPYCCYSYRNYC
uniref:Putative 8.9kda 1 8.9 kDa family n=1 Tax=Amblyomma aureolatum TaxID=187763 RepID=A0A1E1WXQ2_9ACAR